MLNFSSAMLVKCSTPHIIQFFQRALLIIFHPTEMEKGHWTQQMTTQSVLGIISATSLMCIPSIMHVLASRLAKPHRSTT